MVRTSASPVGPGRSVVRAVETYSPDRPAARGHFVPELRSPVPARTAPGASRRHPTAPIGSASGARADHGFGGRRPTTGPLRVCGGPNARERRPWAGALGFAWAGEEAPAAASTAG